MQRAARGLTLIETAIVLTIVGFVAAFALPAWHDHTLREKVAEVVAAAEPAKATVDDYVAANGALPSTQAIALPFINSKHVLGSTWAASGTTGAVTVSTRPATGQDEAALDAKRIVLTASFDAATKTVHWVCGGTPETTVESRLLPDDCRPGAAPRRQSAP